LPFPIYKFTILCSRAESAAPHTDKIVKKCPFSFKRGRNMLQNGILHFVYKPVDKKVLKQHENP